MTEFKAPQGYLPHRPPMVLLDKVVAITERTCHCEVSVSEHSVLAPFLDDRQNLPNFYALELISQTVGVWSGYQNEIRGRVNMPLGMVISVRDLRMDCAFFEHDSVLKICIESLMEDPTFGSCIGEICCNGTRLCQGRVNVYQATHAQLEQLFKRD
ncbi:MAG: hypothetical protein K6F05_09020 [Succinivibrio sp.]|nr:hypothetical protein [Succinivibrio sp.]